MMMPGTAVGYGVPNQQYGMMNPYNMQGMGYGF